MGTRLVGFLAFYSLFRLRKRKEANWVTFEVLLARLNHCFAMVYEKGGEEPPSNP
jgi:hypothetical protein